MDAPASERHERLWLGYTPKEYPQGAPAGRAEHAEHLQEAVRLGVEAGTGVGEAVAARGREALRLVW